MPYSTRYAISTQTNRLFTSETERTRTNRPYTRPLATSRATTSTSAPGYNVFRGHTSRVQHDFYSVVLSTVSIVVGSNNGLNKHKIISKTTHPLLFGRTRTNRPRTSETEPGEMVCGWVGLKWSGLVRVRL